ncbi:PhoU domain-containing protein [Halovenus marina]|uniref:PhoU domain-containing protein n=1 Tax=Halovenus marina TaxID=3396621 RepID=UPI003F557A76
MDTRKVQTVGGGTYMVSLPKEWAESRDIDRGDTVNVHSHIDGILVIQTGEREEDMLGAVTVPVTADDADELERTLRAAYAAGSTEVTFDAVETFTNEQRRVINQVARNLPGVSIAEESDTSISVRTLLDADEVSIRQSVRQLKFVALSMHRDATAPLTGETEPASLADRDDQADRLYAMIDRTFTRGLARLDQVDALELTRPELFELWAATHELERVADHAEALGTAVRRIDGSVDQSMRDEIDVIASQSRQIVSESVDALVGDGGVDTLHETLNARDALREEITACTYQLSTSETNAERVIPVLDRLRRTAEHGGNIAEFGLRRAVREGNLSRSTSKSGSKNSAEQKSQFSTGE